MESSNPQHDELEAEYRSFVDEHVVPLADRMDAEEATPPELVQLLATRGYLGMVVPEELGGRGKDMLSFGLLCHEIGRGSASLLSLLTVHSMLSLALVKWGSDEQRARFLLRLMRGERIGAFALTEPDVGSAAGSVQTTAVADGEAFILNGVKKWISYAQIADLFLVVARCEGKPTAFVVERSTPGLRCAPIRGMLGFRAAMLGELTLEGCVVPAVNMLGRVGFGLSHVVGTALDSGRYSIAWGSVGLAQECLDLSLSYSNTRVQGGSVIGEHQLIQRMIADMVTDVTAARALCVRAAGLRNSGEPESILETSVAKYFASRVALRVASDAVQIHGAQGCGPESSVQRHFRDARIMEIIEGSTQIQQQLIARSKLAQHRAKSA